MTVTRAQAVGSDGEKGEALRLDVEVIPLTVPEVRRLLVALVWSTAPPEEQTMGWSFWRRRHQARARRCHYKRRLERLTLRNEQPRLYD
ncbi:MAG TPA: hypothetical protein VLA19_00040 [Herpetosiphonaceae bacterium]|nr:hypothetical protein [Herpetosiphonaceae bacterium]